MYYYIYTTTIETPSFRIKYDIIDIMNNRTIVLPSTSCNSIL